MIKLKAVILCLIIPLTLDSSALIKPFLNGILNMVTGTASYLHNVTISVSATNVFNYSNCSNIIITGQFADTSVCGRGYAESSPISVSGSSGVTTTGLFIHDQSGTGILYNNVTTGTIEDNIIRMTTGSGIEFNGTTNDIEVRLNWIRGVGGRGFYMNTNNLSVGNVRVDSNLIMNINSASLVAAIQFNKAGAGLKMIGNYVFHDPSLSMGGDILSIIGSVGTSGSHNIISNNYVEGYNGLPQSAVVQVDEDCFWVDVLNNVGNQGGSKGISVVSSENVLVDGNKMYAACVLGITNVGYSTGVLTINCSSVTFSNNKGWWFCGRQGVCMGPTDDCADFIEAGSFFEAGCIPVLVNNDFSYDAIVPELIPPAGAQYAYAYWFGCAPPPLPSQGIILTPPHH